MSEGYLRHLLSEEIADLEMNGCTAIHLQICYRKKLQIWR